MSALRYLMWPYYWKNIPLAKSCLSTMSVLFGYPHPHFPFLRKNGVFSKGPAQNWTGPCWLSPFGKHRLLHLVLPSLGGGIPDKVLYNNTVTRLSSHLQPSREEVPFRHQVTMGHPHFALTQQGSMACVSN